MVPHGHAVCRVVIQTSRKVADDAGQRSLMSELRIYNAFGGSIA